MPYYTLLTYESYTKSGIKVEPNTDYELSMMVKGDQGVALQTRVQTSNSGGIIGTLNTNAGPKWVKAAITVNSGDKSELVIAMLNNCMSTGTMYIDDLRLTNLSTGENVLTNSSFEPGEDGKNTGWGNFKFPWSWVENDTYVTPPPVVDPEPPVEPGDEEGEVTTVYKNSFGNTGKSYVDVKFAAADNGKKKVTVGGVELFYSVQRECYVGLVDASAVADNKIAVETSDEAPTILVYGNVNGSYSYADISKAVDGTDVLFLKRFNIGTVALSDRQLFAADVDGNGKADGTDVLVIKRFNAGTLAAFPVLSK